MINERLARIEATLREAQAIPEATRHELLALVDGLKAEVTPLLETHQGTAREIADHAHAAVEAAMRKERHPDQAAETVKGLADSVRAFEATHPRLVEAVDRLALTLSNMGI